MFQAELLKTSFAVFLVFAAGVVSAHPTDEWQAQQLALARWAEGLANRDPEAIQTVAASLDSVGFVLNDATHVITRYAEYERTPAGVIASPVVIYVDGGSFRIVMAVNLVESEGGWQVASSIPTTKPLPEALLTLDLPETVMLSEVEIHLTEEGTGGPVHARVRVTDGQSRYWPPDGHQKKIRTGWREDVGGDVTIAGKTWAYVQPSFTVRVPVGSYTLEVEKGTEYRPASKEFEVKDLTRSEVDLSVERWSDLNAEGWYAGDTHTHFLAERTGLLELRAEDLSVIYVLATKWGELITDVERFTGRPGAYSTPSEVVIYNEETRHSFLGHTILHGIDELIYPLTWGGPTEGVPGGYDWPAMAHQADRAHAAGGLVTWAHFPSPGGELSVDIGLDKIDTVDLFTWGDAWAKGQKGDPTASTLDWYYRFLNTGSRMPATAGTDKMLNVQVSGSVRTWAQVGDAFSYAGWMEALEAGRTFVSTGPIVRLSANGRPIGSDLDLAEGDTVLVEASMEAPFDLYPVEQLEIVVGGEVVARVDNSGNASELHLEAEVEVEESTWVVARANGSKMLPYQVWPLLGARGIPPMAHTSPIYLTIDGRAPWSEEDAAILASDVRRAIDWVEARGRYQTDEQREEILELFRRALAVYQR